MKLLRRLYDWVLHWAQTPYGMPALFLLTLPDPAPVPDTTGGAAHRPGRRRRQKSVPPRPRTLRVVGAAQAASVRLPPSSWGAWSAVDQLFFAYVPGFTEEVFANVQAKYEKWNFWVVFTSAFTPIPFKVFTIAAGVFGINFVKFTLAAVVGRSARFFLVAGLLYWFGEPIRKFIDKWFNLLTLLFTIIFIGSFVILKYM